MFISDASIQRAGKQFWKKFVDGIGSGTLLFLDGSETSPAVANNKAYVATYDGILYSFNATNGALRWKGKTHYDTDSPTVSYDHFVYACADEKAPYLYGFVREDGQQMWRYDSNQRGYYATLEIAKGRVWVGAGRGLPALG